MVNGVGCHELSSTRAVASDRTGSTTDGTRGTQTPATRPGAPRGPPRRPAQSRTMGSSPGPPSGEDVGCLVVDELVVELRQQPAGVVVEAAVAGGGGVATEGAAAHRHRPT